MDSIQRALKRPRSYWPVSMLLAILFLHGAPPARVSAEGTVPITRDHAVRTAIEKHPDLAAFVLEIDAARARMLQASLPPDPELEIESANLTAEATAAVSQLYERGGKREARTQAAEREIPVLEADLEILRQDVAAEASRAFVRLLASQERLEVKEEAFDTANRLAATVAEMVAVGAVSPIEETRARVTLASAATEVDRARSEVEEARIGLAEAMGIAAPKTIGDAEEKISTELSVPDLPALLMDMEKTPDLARWRKERERRQAAVDSEAASAATDLTFRGAYTRDEINSENILTFGVSIPLRIRDKNQGAIAEARADLARVDREEEAAHVRLSSRLAQRLTALANAARAARRLEEETIAGALDAHEAVSEGYRLGKFRYLDVLDAWGVLIDVRLRRLDALVDLELARIDLDRLTGKSAPAVSSPGLP